MSFDMGINFESDDEETIQAPVVEPASGSYLGGDFADENDLMTDELLTDVPLCTVLFELASRSTQLVIDVKNFKQMKLSELATVFAAAQVTSPKNLIDKELGDMPTNDQYALVRKIPTHLLMGYIHRGKARQEIIKTDFVAADDLLEMHPTTVSFNKETHLCEALVQGELIRFYGIGPKRGRIYLDDIPIATRILAGQGNGPVKIVAVEELAVQIGFALHSQCKLKRVGNHLKCIVEKYARSVMVDCDPSTAVTNLVHKMSQRINICLEDPNCGFPQTAVTTRTKKSRETFTHLAQYVLDRMAPVDRIWVVRKIGDGKEHFIAAWKEVEQRNNGILAELSEGKRYPNNVYLKELFTRGHVVSQKFGRVDSPARLNEYVERSRSTIRSIRDNKKSDTDALSMGKSPLNVPVKIKAALNLLTEDGGPDLSNAEIHAWGTGSLNHFHSTLEATGAKVKYLDIDPLLKPKQIINEFEARDITAVPPGYGGEKLLVDDTHTLVVVGGQSSVAKVPDYSKKLASVLDAGYTGGIMKLYYGYESAGRGGFRRVPDEITAFIRRYGYVRFAHGGTLHTPEYYMVFRDPLCVKDGCVCDPPDDTALRQYTIETVIVDGPDGKKKTQQRTVWKTSTLKDEISAREKIYMNFITLKVHHMLVSNQFINLQLALGHLVNSDEYPVYLGVRVDSVTTSRVGASPITNDTEGIPDFSGDVNWGDFQS